MKRKICLITTSRAEYGIMSGLIKEISSDKNIEFSLIASGTHLSEKHGLTYKEIENDGIYVDFKIDIGIDKEDDGEIAIANVMSTAIAKFTDVLTKIKPDIVIILGDRYEIMSAAIACMICNIPIAHIHGGETTQGAMDEAIRHSITKMSHLHFASCEEYAKRIIQLGENPKTVFNVGALGVENSKTLKLKSKEELEDDLKLKFGNKNLLITFHPVTLEKNQAEKQINELLEVLAELKDTTVIFTKPNADAENKIIADKIDEFVANNPNAYAYTSLGTLRYLSMMQFIDGVVGNSSSGIIEVPSFKIGTVNIGDRQKGRVQAKSIINCNPVKEEILPAIQKIYSAEFKKILSSCINPYNGENIAYKIKEIVKNFETTDILKKEFYTIMEVSE